MSSFRDLKVGDEVLVIESPGSAGILTKVTYIDGRFIRTRFEGERAFWTQKGTLVCRLPGCKEGYPYLSRTTNTPTHAANKQIIVDNVGRLTPEQARMLLADSARADLFTPEGAAAVALRVVGMIAENEGK